MVFSHLSTLCTHDFLLLVDAHIQSTYSGRGGTTACSSPRFFETPYCRLSSGGLVKRPVSLASPSAASTVLNLNRAKRIQNKMTKCCVATSQGPHFWAQMPGRPGTSPLPTAASPTNGFRRTRPHSANNSSYTVSAHVWPLPQLGTAPAGDQDTFRDSQSTSQHPLKGFL